MTGTYSLREAVAAKGMISGTPFDMLNGFALPYLTTRYDPVTKRLYNKWQGFLNPADIIFSAKVMLIAMEEASIVSVINDNRPVEGPWYDANDYLANEWLPAASALGIKAIAQVLSPDVYAALSAEEMLSRLGDGGLVVGQFISIQEAERWLASQGY